MTSLAPTIQRGGGDQLVNELHGFAGDIVEAHDPEARGHIAGELFLPAPLHLRLDRHRLQRFDAGDAFDQERLVLRAAPELLVETPAEQRRQSGRDPDVEGECGDRDKRQHRRIAHHHGQKDECEQQIERNGERRTGDELADVLELAHAGDRVADAARLEIGDRQRDEMAEQPGPQLDVDAVGRVRKQVGAQGSENRLEHADSHESEDQDVERAQAAMHQHLVDHDLEEQRRDQREELQEERGGHNLGEHRPVLADGAHEPGDVEAARKIRQACAACHQDQAAAPNGLELFACHRLRALLSRALHQHLVSSGAAQDQEAAVEEHGDARQRSRGQPLPAGRQELRLEVHFFGAPEHFGDAYPRRPDPVTDLFRFGAYSVTVQHDHQRHQRRFGLGRIDAGRFVM